MNCEIDDELTKLLIKNKYKNKEIWFITNEMLEKYYAIVTWIKGIPHSEGHYTYEQVKEKITLKLI